MKNKNTRLIICGSLFKDTIVSTFKDYKRSILDQSVFNSSIRNTYGGIFNILSEKNKKEEWNLFSDKRNKIKNNKIYFNFSSIPKAIILENFFNNRLSFVKKGEVRTYKKLSVVKNQIFLGLYLESLPIKIEKNSGIVIFDFNSSGDILDKKIFQNNFSKINFLLGSTNELKWIKKFNNFNKKLTIIEHSPKEVIIKKPFAKKRIYLKIKNQHFIKNSKKTIGLGDMFALFFARNLKNNLTLEENVKNIQKRISNYMKNL